MEHSASDRPACAGCGHPVRRIEPVWLVDPEIGALRTSWLRLPAGAGELWHAECAEAGGIDGG